MKSIRLFILSFLFLLIPGLFIFNAPLQARGRQIEVRPGGRELIETEGRQIITAPFLVTNSGDEKQAGGKPEFAAEVKIPKGWKLITGEFPFDLDSGKSETRLVSFFVPQQTPPGKYEITYIVRKRKNPSVSDLYTIYVIVLPVIKIKVTLLEAPDYIIAGEKYCASFIISNEGNVITAVNLGIESGLEYQATSDTDKLGLDPHTSKVVAITVKTDMKLRKRIKHSLRLTATVPDFKNGEIKAEEKSYVTVIPLVTKMEEPFHKLPVKIKLQGISKKNKERLRGGQIELSGSGALDEGGERHINFFFREPSSDDKSMFNNYDEYRLSYSTKNYQFHCGDRSYSLSPLTRANHYSRGFEGRFYLNNFTSGAYQTKSRWDKEEETAAYMKYLKSGYELGINYFKKKTRNLLTKR